MLALLRLQPVETVAERGETVGDSNTRSTGPLHVEDPAQELPPQPVLDALSLKYARLQEPTFSGVNPNVTMRDYALDADNTNSIENICSLLKRSIIGAYHQVSIKHLDAYLVELEWRYNNRDNPWLFRDTLLRLLRAENLPYQELAA